MNSSMHVWCFMCAFGMQSRVGGNMHSVTFMVLIRNIVL